MKNRSNKVSFSLLERVLKVMLTNTFTSDLPIWWFRLSCSLHQILLRSKIVDVPQTVWQWSQRCWMVVGGLSHSSRKARRTCFCQTKMIPVLVSNPISDFGQLVCKFQILFIPNPKLVRDLRKLWQCLSRDKLGDSASKCASCFGVQWSHVQDGCLPVFCLSIWLYMHVRRGRSPTQIVHLRSSGCQWPQSMFLRAPLDCLAPLSWLSLLLPIHTDRPTARDAKRSALTALSWAAGICPTAIFSTYSYHTTLL